MSDNNQQLQTDFPIKVGNEANVESFASTLIEGQEQLLITREGNLYLTKGDGTFIKLSSGSALDNQELLSKFTQDEEGNLLFDGNPIKGNADLSNYATKEDIEGLKEQISNIKPSETISSIKSLSYFSRPSNE